MLRRTAALALLLGCAPGAAGRRGGEASSGAAPGWLKGQLHAHSSKSPDGSTPPEQVIAWYAEHGFDFVVITDHNVVTEPPQSSSSCLAIRGVELTQRIPPCEPNSDEQCLQHMNALFVEHPAALEGWHPLTGPTRLAIYEDELRMSAALGGVAQLNHPNYLAGADSAILTELAGKGLRFFELANMQPLSRRRGDATHPSAERKWDDVLSQGLVLYGTATDDAHHFYDARAFRGRGEPELNGNLGWVMVHAEKNAPAIRAALERGDFYASDGVLLAKAGLSTDGSALEVEVAPSSGPVQIDFIAGRAIQHSEGRNGQFALGQARGAFVRAVVTDADGRQAWVQPVRSL
jgi:hypothetical protein